MTEQELRALIREAIARTGAVAEPTPRAGLSAVALAKADAPRQGHSSHALFTLPPGDPEGRCMIEPGVACNHCGYCKSYGH
jgi:hypothetical protein